MKHQIKLINLICIHLGLTLELMCSSVLRNTPVLCSVIVSLLCKESLINDVNISTNFNKTNNHLSPLLSEYKVKKGNIDMW